MLRWIGITALVVYGLVLVSAAVTPDRAPASSVAPASRAAAEDLPQFVGFAINVHHVDQLYDYLRAIDDLAALGCNAVEIVTPMYQRHGASTEIARPTDKCPTDRQLRRILRHARRRGLRVNLMPIVLFSEPRGNEWRGKIEPDDWNAWWVAYVGEMLRFAGIAEAEGVDVLCVGSELLSTERQGGRWSDLIGRVRRRFTGRIAYSTNWDHYAAPTFWPHVDLVGINGYWRIAADPDAPMGEMVERWREIRRQVLDFRERVDRPVLFTEIGYPSLPWALEDPWNYIATDQSATPRVQARGYRAFLAAWDDLLTGGFDDSPLAGVMFYEWDLWHAGGEHDTGYGVRGKPALDLLRDKLDTLELRP